MDFKEMLKKKALMLQITSLGKLEIDGRGANVKAGQMLLNSCG
jgi:hypothetical protein